MGVKLGQSWHVVGAMARPAPLSFRCLAPGGSTCPLTGLCDFSTPLQGGLLGLGLGGSLRALGLLASSFEAPFVVTHQQVCSLLVGAD